MNGTTYSSLGSIPSFVNLEGKTGLEPLDFTITESSAAGSILSTDEKLPHEKTPKNKVTSIEFMRSLSVIEPEPPLKQPWSKNSELVTSEPFVEDLSPINRNKTESKQLKPPHSEMAIRDMSPNEIKLMYRKKAYTVGPMDSTFSKKQEIEKTHKKDIQELLDFCNSRRTCEKKGSSDTQSIKIFNTFKIKDLKDFLETKSKH